MKAALNRILFVLGDCILVNAGIYMAFVLKFDTFIPPFNGVALLSILTCATLINVVVYYMFGLYSRLWVYASIEELIRIFLATVTGSFIGYFPVLFFGFHIPFSVCLISWMITFLSVGGLRLSYRISRKLNRFKNRTHEKKRVLIIGAGEAGSMLIKEIKGNKSSIYNPVAVIDDNNAKHRTLINGVPVIGGRESVVDAAKKFEVEEIIIAIPSIPKKEISNIINICKRTQCKLKVLQGVYSIVNEDVSIKKVRDVNIEDLLGRDKITLNTEEIAHYLKDETVIVTGGGGSIGSELCRQIAKLMPKQLLIFDINENSAYELENELLYNFKGKVDTKVIIGSIRDRDRLNEVFSKYRPSVVFHAAAHKHVPLMEENPQEAVKNNIFGSLNVAEYAHLYNCSKFVLISTDKAVNPTNIMGATKRIAEMITQYMNQISSTEFTTVRFGNVLGSNGSVIPLFKKQIEWGGPVTVTHPEITRYFMTIPEAAGLVIQAGAIATGGEIFVLDMGKPVKIVDLARTMITLSGLELGVDIDMVYTGLRPGEKLYEELLITEDGVDVTKNDKIFIEKDSNLDFDMLMQEINSIRNKEMQDINEIRNFIKKIVPTYLN